MCCFSRPARVADTRIFARSSKAGKQFVVYSMRMSARDDLAMILPIPVPKDVKEDAVRFISLEKYPNFFADLDAGFPKPRSNNVVSDAKGGGAPTLKVVSVGAFEASFVPQIKDFSRLDERFRLPTDVWERLPAYKNFGFAVFKLKKGTEIKVHPMAFEFPRANPKELFFPTVHIHDGKVHPRAKFDHELFCQPDQMLPKGWQESAQNAKMFVQVDKTEGMVDGELHIHKRSMNGIFDNGDVLV